MEKHVLEREEKNLRRYAQIRGDPQQQNEERQGVGLA